MEFKSKYRSLLDFLICLAFISLNMFYRSSHAKDLSYLSELSNNSEQITKNYIIGLDGLYMSARPKSDYRNIFRTIKPGSNIYLGYSWKDSIILEFGYLSTTRKSKRFYLPTTDTFLGIRNAQALYINGQVRFRNTHFNLNFITNFYKNINIHTSIGIGFVRPNIRTVAKTSTSVLFDYPAKIIPRTNSIFRAGIGLGYILNEKVSLRFMGHFEHNSKIRLRQPTSITFNKPFENSYILSIGIFSKMI